MPLAEAVAVIAPIMHWGHMRTIETTQPTPVLARGAVRVAVARACSSTTKHRRERRRFASRTADAVRELPRGSVLRPDGLPCHAGQVAGDQHLDVELRARDRVQRPARSLIGRGQAL